MPATLSYPGVYIEEAPSAVRTIVGVATSIAAFVGRAPRGPVDWPVVINSYADFERSFGGLWMRSTLGFAVRAFFLNGGTQAVVVRLFGTTAAGAVLDNARATQQAEDGASAVADAATAALAAAGASAASVALAVNQAAAAAAAAGPAATAAARAVALAATKVALSRDVRPTPQAVATAATQAQAAAVLAAVAATPTLSGRARLKADTLELEAADPGAWGNSLRVRIDHDVDPALLGQAFNLTVRDPLANITELFRNVTGHDGPRRLDRVLLSGSRLVRVPTGAQVPLAAPAPHRQPANGQDIWKLDTLSSGASALSDDGSWLTLDDFVGAGKDDRKQGLYALRRANLFNLLCIPPYLDPGAGASNSQDIDSDLLPKALQFCAERRALMIVDPPSAWADTAAAIDGIDAFRGPNVSNAAFYFPRVLQPNPLRESQLEAFAASGAVAGVMARTDATRGVWKAPAGLEASIGGVQQLALALGDGEIGQLNPLGINCLRSTPVSGFCVWGARTLDGADQAASQWKYVSVRRTALFIEESLFRATQWIVFEPNDEPLWSQIRLNIGAFMHGLFRQGAFQGASPKDAYFVKCDKTTTTQDDINRGIVNIIVGFAPLKPAEFVVIQLQQIAGQIDA
ncbi:Phage tail sheath family protein [Rubrivivax sp. A210]|uniref:phage tail sheath family protein n=1 Tax=Rubrivivax sp. A210 TaxID=2772301 RepID=UPI00198CF52A|nr:phage tail sheath C-terminal domain-containing protein [Rubrivivax sp. A210]CAD5367059.1 Phage tail sheath family protein [Rubrivivax sp. A210]